MEIDNHILSELYNKIRRDDSKAFETLYHLMYKRLYSVANTILEYKELTEEALEEVFTSLWMNRHKADVDNIFTYLYVLTKNKAIDVKRKEVRWDYLTLEDVHDDLFHCSVTPETLGISVKTVDNHLAAAIRDVLEALQKQDIDSGSRMRLMSWLL